MKHTSLHALLHNQKIRFLFVGILNTLVGYGAFALFVYFKLHYTLAITLATCIGTLHSYAWNKYFTFKRKEKSGAEFVRFLMVYGGIYLMNIVALWLFVDVGRVNPLVSQAIILILITITSYVGHKHWSFK